MIISARQLGTQEDRDGARTLLNLNLSQSILHYYEVANKIHCAETTDRSNYLLSGVITAF